LLSIILHPSSCHIRNYVPLKKIKILTRLGLLIIYYRPLYILRFKLIVVLIFIDTFHLLYNLMYIYVYIPSKRNVFRLVKTASNLGWRE
jgi:hypothetical protein